MTACAMRRRLSAWLESGMTIRAITLASAVLMAFLLFALPVLAAGTCRTS